jgi:hypothetical protein
MRLSDHIAATGLTIPQWAKAKGFAVGTVVKWARRERTPRPAAMRRLIKATDGQVTPADFFEAA